MPNKPNFNNKAFLLINVILAQTLLVLFMGFYSHLWVNKVTGFLALPQKGTAAAFVIAGLFLAVIALALVGEVGRLAEKELQARDQEIQLEKAEEMIRVLRAHRHDFLNHLSVISGFSQLAKYGEVVDYIKDVTRELQVEGRIITLSKPELAALILTKLRDAEDAGFKVETNIQSNLAGLVISATDLVRIVGNLLDNALYALKKASGYEHTLSLKIEECKGEYRLAVSNTGSYIDPEIWEKIFQADFTTKGSDGSGLGLFIVRSLAEKYRGRVDLESSLDHGTTFTVRLPGGSPRLS